MAMHPDRLLPARRLRVLVRLAALAPLVVAAIACTGGATVIAGPSEDAAAICGKAVDYCNGPASDRTACTSSLSKVPSCLPSANAFIDCLISNGATCKNGEIDEDLPACADAERALNTCGNAQTPAASASASAGRADAGR